MRCDIPRGFLPRSLDVSLLIWQEYFMTHIVIPTDVSEREEDTSLR